MIRKAKRSSAANRDGSGQPGSVFGRRSGATRAASPGAAGASAPSPRRPLRLAFTTLASLTATGALLAGSVAPAAAACPNESLRTGPSAALPDCRAYEQASPVEKNSLDAVGVGGLVQASPDGDAITFFAVAPFPQTVGSAQEPSYRAIRTPGTETWLTQGLEASLRPNAAERVEAVTEGLSKTILEVNEGLVEEQTPCEPVSEVCAAPGLGNTYVRDNATGAVQLLTLSRGVHFVFATADGSHIFFEDNAQLTPEANPGVNLYEWNQALPPAERVSLAGVLPDSACGAPPCAPAEGSFAGPGGPAMPNRGFAGVYNRNAVSEDGSRVFFSDAQTGDIYMREPEANPPVTIPISQGQAFWRTATSDGSYVYYTEGPELYRFNVNRFLHSTEPEITALAEAREQLTSGAEGLLGVLGASESDGAYVYFVAPGELAENENANNERAIKGAANLYVWHEGEPKPTFIARLVTEESIGGASDESDWTATRLTKVGAGGEDKSSRVSLDGRYLLFSSMAQLTPYDNRGLFELYRYDAGQPLSAGNPQCVSCNPAWTPAIAMGRLGLAEGASAVVYKPTLRNAFLTRNLSANGRRVFFETEEALLPADANLQNDVYEWEADGEGSCQSEAEDGGCLYMISTGQSTEPTYFGDASENGSDVFFFTRQHLLSQDIDDNADLYDARSGGGILSQNPPPHTPPCKAEACRPPVSAPPTESTPGSESLIGFSNPTYCRPGFLKRNGACVRKPHNRRKHHHKHRRSRRRVGRNRGGQQ